MIVEKRTYTLKIGALPAYRSLYLAEGFEVQKEILGQLIGYYFTDIGPQNQVIHLWGYDSYEDRDRRRAELMADSRWLSYISKAKEFVAHQESLTLRPLM